MKRSNYPVEFEWVAVSSRIRLARNFRDYPFPARLMKDPHAAEQASEMIRLLSAELESLEDFTLYEMDCVSDERAAVLTEKYLISRDLIKHRPIAAALVSKDESISVMINEEDHVREQYFMQGLDLKRAYERISGIDDVISDSIPFAYDAELGYLTACPTNLGTGLRASVMLFLPAISRRKHMRHIIPTLNRLGLTVRGTFGEGSLNEGDMFQVSNEVTLGKSEEDILLVVEQAVGLLVETELRERGRMKAEEGLTLKDTVMRAYGVLTNCCLLDEKEFTRRLSDLKLGIALGYFGMAENGRDDRMRELNDLAIAVRPAGISRILGEKLTADEESAYRAEYVSKTIKSIDLFY